MRASSQTLPVSATTKSLLSQTGTGREIFCIKIASCTLFHRTEWLSQHSSFWVQNTIFLLQRLCIATTVFSYYFFFLFRSHLLHWVLIPSCPLGFTSLQLLSLLLPCFFVLLQGNCCLRSMFALHLYVSNHNSSVKSTLPLSDSQVWAHGAQECLPLFKADFKCSQFKRDVLQWHEVSRLNRSTAPAVSLARTGWAVACVASVLWWQDTASYGLNINRIISWQSLLLVCYHPDKMILDLHVVFSWQRWPEKRSSNSLPPFSLWIICGFPVF